MNCVSRISLMFLWPALWVATPAIGACVPDGTKDERQECALRQLTLQDTATDKLYERLLKTLEPEPQRQLQTQQRTWLEARDLRCDKLVQRDTKGEGLLESRHTACLIALSEQRGQQLQQRLDRDGTPDATKKPDGSSAVKP